MEKILIETIVHADLARVWKHWNDPESIKAWAFASGDWECPYAENDLRIGGTFLTRMSARDGSASFDFTGVYTEVLEGEKIAYLMDKAEDETSHRECEIWFQDLGGGTTQVKQMFTPEATNSIELQKAGWSAILQNFKTFVEGAS